MHWHYKFTMESNCSRGYNMDEHKDIHLMLNVKSITLEPVYNCQLVLAFTLTHNLFKNRQN